MGVWLGWQESGRNLQLLNSQLMAPEVGVIIDRSSVFFLFFCVCGFISIVLDAGCLNSLTGKYLI